MIDGSYVTAKVEPGDIDAAILLPHNFQHLIEQGFDVALELEEMILIRRPEEIFAAEDEIDWTDWTDWIDFFFEIVESTSISINSRQKNRKNLQDNKIRLSKKI